MYVKPKQLSELKVWWISIYRKTFNVAILVFIIIFIIIIIGNISSLNNSLHLRSCTHDALSAMFYNMDIACSCAGNNAAM